MHMRVTKCDFCKKNIKNEPVLVRFGYLNSVELCEKCGKPVLDFLKKNKIIKPENNKEINKWQ